MDTPGCGGWAFAVTLKDAMATARQRMNRNRRLTARCFVMACSVLTAVMGHGWVCPLAEGLRSGADVRYDGRAMSRSASAQQRGRTHCTASRKDGSEEAALQRTNCSGTECEGD